MVYIYYAAEGSDGDANLAGADIHLVGVINGVSNGAIDTGDIYVVSQQLLLSGRALPVQH